MDFLTQNWSLLLLAVVSGGLLAFEYGKNRVGGGGVAPAEAVRLMNREKGVLIDVVEPAEFAAGHPAGARNLPLAQVAAASGAAKPDAKSGLPVNKALPVIVTCASGARAARAAAQLKKAGWANTLVLAGGNRAWRDAGLPIERSV